MPNSTIGSTPSPTPAPPPAPNPGPPPAPTPPPPAPTPPPPAPAPPTPTPPPPAPPTPTPKPVPKSDDEIRQELSNYLVLYRAQLQEKYNTIQKDIEELEKLRKKVEDERKLVYFGWAKGSRDNFSSSVNIVSVGVTGASFSLTGASIGLAGVEQSSGLIKSGVWGAYKAPAAVDRRTAVSQSYVELEHQEAALVKEVNALAAECKKLVENHNSLLRIESA